MNQQSVLVAICERVRFACRRFGRYDVIDFLAVLFGYTVCLPALALSRFWQRSP